MDEGIRDQLREIVAHYGREIAADPRRIRAILADTFPEKRRELAVLVAAVEESVPRDLLERTSSVPPDSLRWQLEQRLVDQRALSPEAARWAVQTWAWALDVDVGAATAPPIATPPMAAPPIGPAPPPAAPQDYLSTIPAGSLPPPAPYPTGSGWPAPAPGPLNRGRRPVPVAVLAGGALVLLAAAVVAAFLLKGGSPGPTPTRAAVISPTPGAITPTASPTPSPTPTQPPTPTRPPTPPPSVTPTPPPLNANSILKWVSLTGTDRATCEEILPDPPDYTNYWPSDAAAVVRCGPLDISGTTARIYRRYALYPSWDALTAAYDSYVEVGAATVDTGDCPTDVPSEQGWSYSNPDTADMGRELCFVQDAGPYLFFTAKHAFVMGVINGSSSGTKATIENLANAFTDSAGILRP